MGKIIEISGMDPGKKSFLFYWDAKSSTDNPTNIELWDDILAYAKENGMAVVFMNNSNDYSGNFIKILSSAVPTTAGSTSFKSEVGTVSSSGSHITTYKGSVSITVDSDLKVTAVGSLSNSIASYIQTYRFTSNINVLLSLNVSTYLNPGSWGLRISANCTGAPITLSGTTSIVLETKTTYDALSATYAPYVRQDIYIPSLDRHWYRIVNYAASNNITYGEWKEIDLAFEIVE